MKIAILHYWFITRRGGEKVVESLLKLFPQADIYTLFYDKEKYGNFLENNTVYTSILNHSSLRKYYQKLFPLYTIGVKSIKLKKKYDLIISSESGPIKGVKIRQNTPHICYVHSPMRYCWSHKDDYLKAVSPLLRPVMSYFLTQLKKYDISTINNVDFYITNSRNIEERVLLYYHKKSEIIYPPIAQHLFEKPLVLSPKKEYYLSFGAITPYKKIDLLVETFNKNGKKLIIIGDGSEREKLEKKSQTNITFKGTLPWEEIEEIIKKSKALLFPGEEDFGMIPLEMMTYGLPVIAYKKGGAIETVIENKKNIAESSGVFFNFQTIKSLEKSIDFFEEKQHEFNPIWIRNHAKNFSEYFFLKRFKELLISHKLIKN